LLRELDFVGAYPHWHRTEADGEAWIASVQHDKYGGAFRAELAWLPPRALFPKLEPRPRIGKSLKASSVWPDFRVCLPLRSGRFIDYTSSLERAVALVVAAVRRALPAWFLENRAVARRLGKNVSTRTLARLVSEALWVRGWIEANAGLPGCRAHLRTQLARATESSSRAWIAWKLAEHGDARAHALLVELLDDPDLETRSRSMPGASMRAAQSLAAIHGLPFRWGSPASVERIRKQFAGERRSSTPSSEDRRSRGGRRRQPA
jgi:hypothetical protein